jgi:hypothetical protein
MPGAVVDVAPVAGADPAIRCTCELLESSRNTTVPFPVCTAYDFVADVTRQFGYWLATVTSVDPTVRERVPVLLLASLVEPAVVDCVPMVPATPVGELEVCALLGEAPELVPVAAPVAGDVMADEADMPGCGFACEPVELAGEPEFDIGTVVTTAADGELLVGVDCPVDVFDAVVFAACEEGAIVPAGDVGLLIPTALLNGRKLVRSWQFASSRMPVHVC